MAVQAKRYTVEEFDRFVELPENADKLFEYIGGEIIEVPSNPYTSQIASLISAELVFFLKGKDLGHVTGEAGGYMVSGERYAPDVAFISRARQPKLAERGYNPNPPDLAVEVWSPSNDPADMRIKITNYLAAGTTVWLVDPERSVVEIHAPGQRAQKAGLDDTLDGGDMLPGFTLAVKDIFPH
jgi:Uma2 family endonuclease